MNQKQKSRESKQKILLAAVKLAKRNGYSKITRDDIAFKAQVSMGLVTYHFNTMKQLRRDLMRYAIAHSEIKIIAEGLAIRDIHARKAPDNLKRAAANLLVQ